MASQESNNDKSHHNKSGGFTNPWPSFRNVSLFAFMSYARKNWDREGSKVPPPQSDLYVKVLEETRMAWEKIRNPPKDKIQATWYYLVMILRLIARLGHASFLVQMDGINILTDPIWSHRYILSLFQLTQGALRFSGLAHHGLLNRRAQLLRFPPLTSSS